MSLASMADYKRCFGRWPPAGALYGLYDALVFFFANGGMRCLVVSVGTYEQPIAATALIDGLAPLTRESTCSLVVVPDAARLPLNDCVRVHTATLAHCGEATRNRFAILDVPEGDQPLTPHGPVAAFIERMAAASSRAYGAAYYPWLRVALPHRPATLGTLPPSGAIAGVFARMDATRGVWQAPANVALNNVMAAAVVLRESDQASLTSVSGVHVNAIRSFPGKGVLVWGARTLDSNNVDWRYVSVRRTVLMIEDSIRVGLQAIASEPNTEATWAVVRSLVSDFLTQIWRAGGLAGSTPSDAFVVNAGLGDTMTPEDVADGRVRLVVLLAVTRPAEFIELTFDQTMRH